MFSQVDFTDVFKGKTDNSYDFTAPLFVHDIWWRPVENAPVHVAGINDIVQDNYGVGPQATWILP